MSNESSVAVFSLCKKESFLPKTDRVIMTSFPKRLRNGHLWSYLQQEVKWFLLERNKIIIMRRINARNVNFNLSLCQGNLIGICILMQRNHKYFKWWHRNNKQAVAFSQRPGFSFDSDTEMLCILHPFLGLRFYICKVSPSIFDTLRMCRINFL